MKRSNLIAGALVGASLLIMSGTIATKPADPYASQVNQLQTQLSHLSDAQIAANNAKPSTPTVTINSVIKDTKMKKAETLAKDLMSNLYNWDSDDQYNQNQKHITNNDITSPDLIAKIMPSSKDSTGASKIDALNLVSELKSMQIYATDLNAKDYTIVATVSNHSTDDTAQNDDDDSSNLPINYVYKVHYNADINKFSSLEFMHKETLDSSSSDND